MKLRGLAQRLPRRFAQLFFFGPWVAAGLLATLALPIGWLVNPRVEDEDGSNPRLLRDDVAGLILLGFLAVIGLALTYFVARRWLQTARDVRNGTEEK